MTQASKDRITKFLEWLSVPADGITSRLLVELVQSVEKGERDRVLVELAASQRRLHQSKWKGTQAELERLAERIENGHQVLEYGE